MTETESANAYHNHLKIDPEDPAFGQQMVQSIRYALGRVSPAVRGTAEYVERLIPALSTGALERIVDDITRHAECHDLGDKCDRMIWLHLRSIIMKELENRKDGR